jgi:hypothetical protein
MDMLSVNEPGSAIRRRRLPTDLTGGQPALVSPGAAQVEALIRTLMELEGSSQLKMRLMLGVLEQYFGGTSSREQLEPVGRGLRQGRRHR